MPFLHRILAPTVMGTPYEEKMKDEGGFSIFSGLIQNRIEIRLKSGICTSGT